MQQMPLWIFIAASQGANGPHESAMGKIIAFARAVGTAAMLTVNPQSAKPRARRGLASMYPGFADIHRHFRHTGLTHTMRGVSRRGG
jgi:hypothetical protein